MVVAMKLCVINANILVQPKPTSPISFNLDNAVSIHYTKPFKAVAKTVCESIPLEGQDKEYMIQIEPTAKDNGNYIVIAGKRYNFIQFHVHAPSEHQIWGMRMPLEIHFVHESEDRNVAVVGCFVNKSFSNQFNTAMAPFINAVQDIIKAGLPQKEGESEPIFIENEINMAKIFQVNKHCAAFMYDGSKTSGNLAPGVKWTVFVEPLTMSQEQLAPFAPIKSHGTKIHDRNGRDVLIQQVFYEH